MNDLFWLSERQLEHIELSSPLSHGGVENIFAKLKD